jgi:hypothetical protein
VIFPPLFCVYCDVCLHVLFVVECRGLTAVRERIRISVAGTEGTCYVILVTWWDDELVDMLGGWGG